MKTNKKSLPIRGLILLSLLLTSLSCNQVKESQPLSGSNWGVIPNSSVENVDYSVVKDWQSPNDRNAATHFYSKTAHDGTKSLLIHSDLPKFGVWSTKVNVKPWSKYKFTGWIKTENLLNTDGEGAGFNLAPVSEEYTGYLGTNDWTRVTREFETGNEDCLVLECVFNRGGLSTGRVWFDEMSLELISSEKIITSITVDAAIEKEPMSEYIYGQFIEHLGKCIYGGIWAEMIDDRKFWYSPNERMSPWKIEGNKEQIEMDKTNSFVGEQTPVFICEKDKTVSLRQDGLGLRKDITYSGRIILKTSGSIDAVKIRLINGDNKEAIAETIIRDLKKDYTTYPLAFASNLFTHNASLQIIPEGKGKVWLGTISLMPDDNIEGFRADVMELLKGLNSPVYRWPGGNFVSGYDWKDGIGDPDKRPPRKNPAWSGVEHNDVGIHEFMKFCELLDTEPYIAVNAGLGGAEEARKEVEYCNGSSETPMGKWRTKNGHTNSWNVKWWGVGNEMYGSWQLGHMSTEAFAEKHNQFADAMLSADTGIILVAVGDPGRWNEMILANCSDKMDYISEHFYRQDWHGGGLRTHIKQIPEAISERAEIHRGYRKDIPALEGKDIKICMDEWNYWYGPDIYGELGTRYFLRDGLGVAAGLNEFSKNSDMIYMANYAQTVNVIGCIKTNTTHSVYDATGQALKLYREKFGTIPVDISGETRPFNIGASLTADRKTLVVAIVNPSWEIREFDLDLKGFDFGSELEVYTLTGPDDMAHNEPGREEAVVIGGPFTQKADGRYSVDPFSVSLFRFPVK